MMLWRKLSLNYVSHYGDTTHDRTNFFLKGSRYLFVTDTHSQLGHHSITMTLVSVHDRNRTEKTNICTVLNTSERNAGITFSRF